MPMLTIAFPKEEKYLVPEVDKGCFVFIRHVQFQELHEHGKRGLISQHLLERAMRLGYSLILTHFASFTT